VQYPILIGQKVHHKLNPFDSQVKIANCFLHNMASIYQKYSQLIAKRPLITNIITTGFLFGSGDYLAQTLYPSSSKYDYKRTLRGTFYGSIIFAPIGDKWYRLLHKINFPFPKTKVSPTVSKVLNTLTKVGVDQLVFAPFIGIPLYYSVMSVLEFHDNPLQVAREKLHAHWFNTLKTNWVVWPTFQLFNFALIPVQFRLLVVNIFSIGWNCYLSSVLNHKHDFLIENITDVDKDEILI